jgi:hypothetical protein
VEFDNWLPTPPRPASRNLALLQERHWNYLRESEEEIDRLQKEVAALRRASQLAEELKKL